MKNQKENEEMSGLVLVQNTRITDLQQLLQDHSVQEISSDREKYLLDQIEKYKSQADEDEKKNK